MLRIDSVNQTLKICEDGFYEIEGKIFNIRRDIEKSVNSSVVIYEDDILESNENCTGFITKYELTKEKTVDAILRLFAEKDKGDRIGVLNFASAYHPGGGFLKGAGAQEESLCYASTLYNCLSDEKVEGYYKANSEYNFPLYKGNMIYTKGVNFFKDSENRLLDKRVQVDILTCPAINRGRLSEINGTTNDDLSKYDFIMMKRMKRILEIFKSKGCNTLILGAFGCGVFGNNAEDIAFMWNSLFNEDDFKDCFKKVTFAVFDRPPKFGCYNAFEKELSFK